MSETKGNGSGLNMLKRPSDDDKARTILMPDETAAPAEVEASAPGIDKLLKKNKVPQYATVPLNTRIPDWLDTDLDRMLKKHDLVKQEVVISALAEYIGAKPPHEREGKR